MFILDSYLKHSIYYVVQKNDIVLKEEVVFIYFLWLFKKISIPSFLKLKCKCTKQYLNTYSNVS